MIKILCYILLFGLGWVVGGFKLHDKIWAERFIFISFLSVGTYLNLISPVAFYLVATLLSFNMIAYNPWRLHKIMQIINKKT